MVYFETLWREGGGDKPQAKPIWSHINGNGISYEWRQNGQREKAEIYGPDVPALQSAFQHAIERGKTGWDLVQDVFGSHMSNIACIAHFNGKGFSTGPNGEDAIRHFAPDSGRITSAEIWIDGEFKSRHEFDDNGKPLPSFTSERKLGL